MKLTSRLRSADLRFAFGEGTSGLLTTLAQLSVLYEDLRIETFALTATSEELRRLDELSTAYRIHYFLRRSIATLFEFRGALECLSKDKDYKAAKREASHGKAPQQEVERRPLFNAVSGALTFFHKNHSVLESLRNGVGGHFTDEAAKNAVSMVESRGRIEVVFSRLESGGGPKLHYAGEIAAAAFVAPASEPRLSWGA